MQTIQIIKDHPVGGRLVLLAAIGIVAGFALPHTPPASSGAVFDQFALGLVCGVLAGAVLFALPSPEEPPNASDLEDKLGGPE